MSGVEDRQHKIDISHMESSYAGPAITLSLPTRSLPTRWMPLTREKRRVDGCGTATERPDARRLGGRHARENRGAPGLPASGSAEQAARHRYPGHPAGRGAQSSPGSARKSTVGTAASVIRKVTKRVGRTIRAPGFRIASLYGSSTASASPAPAVPSGAGSSRECKARRKAAGAPHCRRSAGRRVALTSARACPP